MKKDAVVLPENVQIGVFSSAPIIPEEKITRSCHQTSTLDPVKWFKKEVQEMETLDQEQSYAQTKTKTRTSGHKGFD